MKKNKDGWFEIVCTIDPSINRTYSNCKDWCNENMSSGDFELTYMINRSQKVLLPSTEIRIQFKNEEDATAFKLRWA